MAISWNNVAAPNLGESNSLFAQAIASLKDAGAGLKDTAKDYQTVVRNRSHAILQDYINSAKTPEELQSEAFNTGFKNLQATLANEYDAVKVNEYRDARGDVLTKRAGDAVALKRNQFGLTQEQLAAKKTANTAQLYALRDKPLEQAALAAKFTADGSLDPEALQKIQLGGLNLLIAQDTIDTNAKTFDARVAKPALDNTATQQGIDASKASVLNQAGQLTLAQQRLQFDKDKAAAEALLKANGGDLSYEQRPVNIANKILTEQKDKVRKLEQAAENANLGKNTFSTMDDVDTAFKKTQIVKTTSSAMDEIKKILIADPTFVKLDPKRQAAIYADTISRMEANNLGGLHDYIVTDGNRKEYAQMAQDSIKAFTGHIGVAKGQVDVLNQDTVLRLNREAGIPLQTAKDIVAYDMGRVDTNPNANAKPAAQTPLQATNAAKIAGLQEKLNTKGLDLIQKASIEKQLKDLGATPQSTAPAVTPVAKQVQKSVYVKSPLDIVSEAVAKRPTPLLPAKNQNAFKSKANNLSIDVGTGKTTPAKNPVAIPDVTWGKPAQAVTLDPILAKLPQQTVVMTYAPDGDTAYGTSKTYTTVGQPQGKVKCRIDSVNAPETSHKAGQPAQTYGEEAGKILQNMILNKEVSIRVTKPTDGSTNYGRDVCQIEVSGKDVSVELLRAGAAWIYPKYNHYGAGGVALQEEAKAAGRGLWQYPNPTDPEAFSHANR